jgi:hypothetical protein
MLIAACNSEFTKPIVLRRRLARRNSATISQNVHGESNMSWADYRSSLRKGANRLIPSLCHSRFAKWDSVIERA